MPTNEYEGLTISRVKMALMVEVPRDHFLYVPDGFLTIQWRLSNHRGKQKFF